MSDAIAALRKQISRIRLLEYAPEMIVGEIAAMISAEIRANTKAQRNPDGSPWAPAKDGRSPILKNAADRVEVRVVGPTTILFRLRGHYARHHLGAVWGKKKRAIIPTRDMPQAVITGIQKTIRDTVEDIITKGKVKPGLAQAIAEARNNAATKAG